jgi:hypothetical protein
MFLFYSDELPVQLTLPRAMREAKNHQQLSSLALLGQGKLFFVNSSSETSSKSENKG